MKTIAQQLSVKDFPFVIKDTKGNVIYFETSDGYWHKKVYDSNGNVIYLEDSEDQVVDNRPKSPCNGRVVVIDGVEYELKRIEP